ncbi:MAG: flagellar hook-basal body protein [Epsilonproteobacteria bacterium]|nr:flagellar hook-basal body protein [Campylobacterota bacterium]
MQTGYYVATGGMVTQFNRLNIISNNLANVNTNGYKSDDVIIGDFERMFKESRDVLPLDNNTKESAKFINRDLNKVPQIVEEWTNFSVGAIKKTGNDLDFALTKKNAFFLVKTPDGIKATRDGSFSINDAGHIVTKEGYEVLTKNYFNDNRLPQINPNYMLKADKDGNLYQNKQKVSSIFIASFNDLKKLKKIGDNLYDYGDMQVNLNDKNSVVQGFIEKSNINPVSQMTQLIDTNRLVEMYQKVMDTQMNEINNDAINKLGNVKA